MPPPPGKPVVLVVTSTLPRWIGDTEPRFVLDLCRSLAGDYRIIALAPHCRGAARREVLEGVEVRRFRYFAAWGEVLAYQGGILPKLRRRPWLWMLVPVFLAAQVWAVARQLRAGRVDVIHAHWLIPQGLAACLARMLAGRPTPLVCTAHGGDVFGLRGAISRVLQRWIARGSARIGVVSSALGEELVRRGVDRSKLRLLPMGVEIPRDPPPRARDANLVAFAGRLVEKKGVDVLLEAFARLAARRPEARLAIAGGGPELDRHRQRAGTLGLGNRVEFLGAVPQARIAQLFARAAVAVMPSVTAAGGDAEGLGLVMLEAMAAGCPVVVSDLPVVRDVIRPGENGLVFAEGDAAALAESVAQLLEDPVRAGRLAREGRALVETRYSWAAAAASHAAAYAETGAL